MKSLSPTVAPRCQHTWMALLLRTDAVAAAAAAVDDAIGVPVPTVDLFAFNDALCCDNGVGDAELRPHVSRPSSDEPVK